MIFMWMKYFCLLCLHQRFTSAYRCDASQFGNLIRGKALNKDILEIINPGGLALCARECLYRTRCKSFNYADSSDTCQLVGAVATGNLEAVPGTYHSEKSTWPMKLAGLCMSHTCLEGKKCVQHKASTSCVTIYYKVLQASETEIRKGVFDVVSGISKDDCIKECFYRSQCESFNHKSNNECELSTSVMLTDLNNYVGNSPGTTYNAITIHDSSLAGGCSNRPCSNEEVCQEILSSFTCNRKYCPKPTNTFQHVVALYDTDREWWPVTTNLTYKCEDGYYPIAQWNCQSDGTWISPSCSPVTRCRDLYDPNLCGTPNMSDGLFILKHYSTFTDVIVYCIVGDILNWIQFPNYGSTFSYFSTNVSIPNCREQNYCGMTVFERIRTTYTFSFINTNTYSTTDCPGADGSFPGRGGKNCNSTCNIDGDNGSFRVDLTGIGLKFKQQTSTFEHGTLQYSHNDQVVTGICDSCVDRCFLSTKTTIAAPELYINYTGATKPVCKTLGDNV